MIYLEIAACRLTSLPPLAPIAPNLRVLNLNYNFLEDARPLAGLTRLRKLTLIGSRVKSTRALVGILKGMKDIEMIDFRYVPTLDGILSLVSRCVCTSVLLPRLRARATFFLKCGPVKVVREVSGQRKIGSALNGGCALHVPG